MDKYEVCGYDIKIIQNKLLDIKIGKKNYQMQWFMYMIIIQPIIR